MRRSLLLVFIISVAILTGLPVRAASPNSTCQTTIRVALNNHPGPVQISTNHGESLIGVVGIKISKNLDGAIVEEYPPSQLWSLGIVPGDKVVAVEGQPINFITFENQCRGRPGQLRHLTIVHNGQLRNIAVPLVDVDKVLSYNRNYQRSASMAVQW